MCFFDCSRGGSKEAADAHMSLCDARVEVEEWLEVCEEEFEQLQMVEVMQGLQFRQGCNCKVDMLWFWGRSANIGLDSSGCWFPL